MTRFVTFTVQVRPHAEQIEVNGQRFDSPEALWQHLHGLSSATAHKAKPLRQSLFVGQDQVLQLRYEMVPGAPAPVPVRRLVSRSKELAAGQSPRDADDMGL